MVDDPQDLPWTNWPYGRRCKARREARPDLPSGQHSGRCELAPHGPEIDHALERDMATPRWSTDWTDDPTLTDEYRQVRDLAHLQIILGVLPIPAQGPFILRLSGIDVGLETAARFADVVRERFGGRAYLVVSDPDVTLDVLDEDALARLGLRRDTSPTGTVDTADA